MAATQKESGPQSSSTNPVAMLYLLSTEGADQEQSQWVLEDGDRWIGRAASLSVAGSIALPTDCRLSEKHASITKRADSVILNDAASTNGSFVNGVRIDRATLHDKDIVRLGSSVFIFRRLDSVDVAMSGSAVLNDVVFRSPEMQQLRTHAEQVARCDDLVLILGETGTGKERLAQYIHGAHRAAEKFVAINCANLTPEMADSTLFGHERGAFTGAISSQLGAFREAGVGTLFLDEVGELPAIVQAKLLRSLAERTIMPVGSAKQIPYQARIIAATNRNLAAASVDGSFRADLLYRLRALTLDVPPLRERREDILPILRSRFAPGYLPLLNRHLVERLLLYAWPENARGLVNLATHFQRRFPQATTLDLQHVPTWLRLDGSVAHAPRVVASFPAQEESLTLPRAHKLPSEHELLALLEQHRGNKAAIARHSGTSERTVSRWLAAHRLEFWQWRRK